MKKYTTTETLEEDFLKVSGVNVLDISEFGKNIGISEIKLDKNEKSSTELLQAKALIEYLKGSGEKSVKLSDSNNTISSGEGSISIGYDAKAKNEGAISIGYNSEASNAGSISIGQDSNVIGVNSIGIGKENDVKSNFTFVIGDENKLGINSNESYVIGSNNEISGRKNISIGSRNNVEGNENILLGSNIVADESINNAVVLGNNSQAVDGAVSVGSFNNRRRISFVGDPLQDYDATNKKYVDERGIKFKGNVNTSTEKLVKLDKILTIDSSE